MSRHTFTIQEFEDGTGVQFLIDGKIKFATRYSVEN